MSLILVLLACVFFIIGVLGTLDNSNMLAVYFSFGIGAFLTLVGVFRSRE